MKTVNLTSDMTRKQIEQLSGFRIAYKEKRKTGVSIKFYNSMHMPYDKALLLKKTFLKMFPNTLIRMTQSYGYPYGTTYSVRVMVPFNS